MAVHERRLRRAAALTAARAAPARKGVRAHAHARTRAGSAERLPLCLEKNSKDLSLLVSSGWPRHERPRVSLFSSYREPGERTATGGALSSPGSRRYTRASRTMGRKLNRAEEGTGEEPAWPISNGRAILLLFFFFWGVFCFSFFGRKK